MGDAGLALGGLAGDIASAEYTFALHGGLRWGGLAVHEPIYTHADILSSDIQ